MHNRQKATADLIVGEKSIVNFIPAILSYSMVEFSAVPYVQNLKSSLQLVVYRADRSAFEVCNFFFLIPLCIHSCRNLAFRCKFIKNSLHNRVSQLINNCE